MNLQTERGLMPCRVTGMPLAVPPQEHHTGCPADVAPKRLELYPCRSPKLDWGIDMKASILSFRTAVLIVIVGMIWGIVMAISQDHSTFPAHAHLNLLGWVS